MPRYSGFTFSVQPVEKSGRVSGYVVSGFFSRSSLKLYASWSTTKSMLDRRSGEASTKSLPRP